MDAFNLYLGFLVLFGLGTVGLFALFCWGHQRELRRAFFSRPGRDRKPYHRHVV